MVKIHFFRTLEINQSLAITQDVFLQEKMADSKQQQGARWRFHSPVPVALSQLGGSPSPESQQSVPHSVKPVVCQPLPVAN